MAEDTGGVPKMGVGKTVHGGMKRCVLHGGGEQRARSQDTRGSHASMT